MGQREYWETRARTYGNLDLVKSKRMAYEIVRAIKGMNLNSPKILDVGCAEGTITKTVRENIRHSQVCGIDLSEKMIATANKNRIFGLEFYERDFFNLSSDFFFPNLIMMNLVIHHLINGKDKEAVLKAFNSLERNGRILIAEAVPPEEKILEEYARIFKLKEERNIYFVPDLVILLRTCGFEQVRFIVYSFKISLLRWLDDKTLPAWKKKVIYRFHVEASKEFKKVYRMSPLLEGDYSLTCKMAIVTGLKP